MAITKFTATEIAQFQNNCPTLSQVDIGTDLNSVIDAVNSNINCDVDISDYKSKINIMCPFNGAKLGDVIQDIIDACNDADHEASDLSADEIAALNGTCGTLKGLGLGDKLQEMIDSVNEKTPTIHVKKITATPKSASITNGSSAEITISVTPANATDKTYAVATDPSGIVTTEISGSKVTVTGASVGTTVMTVTPTDTSASAITCNIEVTSA